MSHLTFLPCLDSPEHASRCRDCINLPRDQAAALGRGAVEAIEHGYYVNTAGERVDWAASVANAVAAKRSLPPEAELPTPSPPKFEATRVQVVNETTLMAAERLVKAGERVLALNFANGIHPGGGFLNGARAQEEVLCRSSALYATLCGDPMYDAHAKRPQPDSSDWAILSPAVPVFRNDRGTALDAPWSVDFLSCAAPYAPNLGPSRAADLLQQRIDRVIQIARAYDYSALVLGAWGCGAFHNDPVRTAKDFRQALRRHTGGFSDVVFAIVDWSQERRFLAPFCAEFE